ncbi:type IV pilin protein [Limnohabitans sp. Jir72]|uniref:type IV pilin protein n=1 Tax=Limnohabitans sp. Jir72 TaxID=1977909 RepID=UPI000D3AA126|nr:type IV pilin protein [Limnohabitans sp. Jir72]PUE24785.1 prepilin-type cleavage/methylation domain-containing protein [Limnohabitans sp. Jir72]
MDQHTVLQHRCAPSVRQAGWTLGEMMIALALMAILAALAMPSYNSQQRQARRADARQALQQVQLEQARWRGQHDQHAEQLSSLGWTSDRSALGHYQIAIEEASSQGYTLKATPMGTQGQDTACNPMRLQLVDSAILVLSSGADPQTDAAKCWRP